MAPDVDADEIFNNPFRLASVAMLNVDICELHARLVLVHYSPYVIYVFQET